MAYCCHQLSVCGITGWHQRKSFTTPKPPACVCWRMKCTFALKGILSSLKCICVSTHHRTFYQNTIHVSSAVFFVKIDQISGQYRRNRPNLQQGICLQKGKSGSPGFRSWPQSCLSRQQRGNPCGFLVVRLRLGSLWGLEWLTPSRTRKVKVTVWIALCCSCWCVICFPGTAALHHSAIGSSIPSPSHHLPVCSLSSNSSYLGRLFSRNEYTETEPDATPASRLLNRSSANFVNNCAQ